MTPDELKQQVSEAAVQYVRQILGPKDVLGVGTGSTMNLFIDALAASQLEFKGAISSSEASATRLRDHGISVLTPSAGLRGALYVDGADEVDPNMALIKGGGGALTREKITASMCERFLCLVDGSKLVSQLGKFPLPVEVIPMAQHQVANEIENMGGIARLREGFVTDNGNVILDVHGFNIDEPGSMEVQLNGIPGVVENGLFVRNRPYLTMVAQENGIQVLGDQSLDDTDLKALD